MIGEKEECTRRNRHGATRSQAKAKCVCHVGQSGRGSAAGGDSLRTTIGRTCRTCADDERISPEGQGVREVPQAPARGRDAQTRSREGAGGLPEGVPGESHSSEHRRVLLNPSLLREPPVSKKLDGMRCADRAVATREIVLRAVFVAAPADALWMLRRERSARYGIAHDVRSRRTVPTAHIEKFLPRLPAIHRFCAHVRPGGCTRLKAQLNPGRTRRWPAR
jgi:hypothetical protein